MLILRKFPSLFFFNVVMFLIQSVLSFLFAMGSILVYTQSLSLWVLLYVAISYFWIQATLSYVTYQTCAGVSCAWYFLNETPYLPAHPIRFALKNTMTTGFGAVALAGFLEAIVRALAWVKKRANALTCGLATC